MSEVFVVAPLDGLDATAVRSGEDILVHISSSVPRRARLAAVEHLMGTVREAGGTAVAASLPAGEAAWLADYQAEPVPIFGAMAAAVACNVLGGYLNYPHALWEHEPAHYLGGLELF